jgi:lipopolysaccharide transport system ATP-binding protein
MTLEPAVEVSNLSKKYKIYHSPWHRALEYAHLARRRLHEENWALQDVSFSVAPGECFGIIGRNGSGKSTILKILAGAIGPTTGTFKIRGRVLALLELGAGFGPELTGRQNVVKTSMLLGLPNGYAKERLPEIEEFAELGEYFDRPIKTYSSGMFVRLAFSTFMFLDPRVLIVDEALSVGDIFFQQKCFESVRRLIEKGTTILYVSHDLVSIRTMCDRVLFIDHGRPQFLGDPEEAVLRYAMPMGGSVTYDQAVLSAPEPVGESFSNLAEAIKRDSLLNGTSSFDQSAFEILAARVVDEQARQTCSVECMNCLTIQFLARANVDLPRPSLGLELYDRFNQLVYAISSINLGQELQLLKAGTSVIASFRVRFSLQSGEYSLAVATAAQSGADHPNTGNYLDRHPKLGPITVFWSRPLLPFYGMTALETELDLQTGS